MFAAALQKFSDNLSSVTFHSCSALSTREESPLGRTQSHGTSHDRNSGEPIRFCGLELTQWSLTSSFRRKHRVSMHVQFHSMMLPVPFVVAFFATSSRHEFTAVKGTTRMHRL